MSVEALVLVLANELEQELVTKMVQAWCRHRFRCQERHRLGHRCRHRLRCQLGHWCWCQLQELEHESVEEMVQA